MADGRHLENRKMATHTQQFERLARNLARWCTLALQTLLTFKIPNFYKSKMADGRHRQKSKKGHISATAWPIGAKYGTVIHIYSENRIGRQFKNLNSWKSKIADSRYFDNSEIAISEQRFDLSPFKLVWWHTLTLFIPSAVKILSVWKSKMATTVIFQIQKSLYLPYTHVTLFKIKTLLNRHVKLYFSNKTANINGKNWPVYNQV